MISGITAAGFALDGLPVEDESPLWAAPREITKGAATISLITELARPGETTLVSRVLDAAGRKVWEGSAAGADIVRQTAKIGSPKLWSPETASLSLRLT
jgi:hypothetical protein